VEKKRDGLLPSRNVSIDARRFVFTFALHVSLCVDLVVLVLVFGG
jgi:hypothetical protein